MPEPPTTLDILQSLLPVTAAFSVMLSHPIEAPYKTPNYKTPILGRTAFPFLGESLAVFTLNKALPLGLSEALVVWSSCLAT